MYGPLQALRAPFRLVLLFLATLYEMARVTLHFMVKGVSPELAASHARDWARLLARVCGLAVEVSGPTPPPGALIVANHRSYVDIAALLHHVGAIFLAKVEIASWPVLGPAAKLGCTVFVDREDRDSRKAARGQIRATLASGVTAIVFPEGTTHAGPGALPFRPGIFHMAAENDFAVVPAAIEYESRDDAWVGGDTFIGHFLARHTRPRMVVRVGFGPALRGDDAEALRHEAERWIGAQLARPEFTAAPAAVAAPITTTGGDYEEEPAASY